MEIGTFLKDTREAANISLPDLATLSGVSPAALKAYERGRRAPRIDQVDQILAGLGLRLRVEAEPMWAEVDAALDAAAAMPIAARLEGLAVDLLGLLGELGDLPCVVEGMCAAALLGAPVPVAVIDLILPVDDDVLERFTKWANFHARRWSDRYRTFAFATADPRQRPDPLRYETSYGELRLRLADPLPESITVEVGDLSVRVLDLRGVDAGDEASGRVLERMRQRLTSQE